MNLDELKRLAGINEQPDLKTAPHFAAQEKRKIEREKGLEVGSDEWMKLWFSKGGPQLDMPKGFRGRKK
jgi:hypothetical protein